MYLLYEYYWTLTYVADTVSRDIWYLVYFIIFPVFFLKNKTYVAKIVCIWKDILKFSVTARSQISA